MTATKRKRKPITANPLFPLVTALWLATFLGLGSFAIAPALLEGPVVALGIPALVPAAAPPLGFTARVLFAVVMMGVGAIAGYGIGRILGREKVIAPVRTRGFGKAASAASTFESRRPINAAEDLGAPLDSAVEDEAPLRRRAFSLADETHTETLPEYAPDMVTPSWDDEQVGEPGPSADADPLSLDLLFEEASEAEPAPFSAAIPDYSAPVYSAEADAEQPEPTSFTAPRWSEPAEVEPTAISHDHSDVPVFAAPAVPSPFLQAQAGVTTPIDRAPLDSLGLVPLIERLALAISRRAARTPTTQPAPATGPAATTEPAATPDFVVSAPAQQQPLARFEKAPIQIYSAVPNVAEEAATALAFAPEQPERVVQLRPAALQPVQTFADPMAEIDGDEEEDLGLERFLRMSPLLARKPAQIADENEIASDDTDEADENFAPEPEVAEDRYPSLLDMGPVVARREPLRIDDSESELAEESSDEAGFEPAVVFPGQEVPVLNAPVWPTTARPFERPTILPLPGSPLASPGRASPSAQTTEGEQSDLAENAAATPDAEEADRALRAALATLQRMTAQG